MPLEDVVENMRKDVRIKLLDVPTCCAATLEISCEYPDNFKAQSVVREVVSKFVEQINTTQRDQAPPATVFSQQILDPANLPGRPFFPNRPFMVAVGFIGGAVLGLSAVLVQRSGAALQECVTASFAPSVASPTCGGDIDCPNSRYGVKWVRSSKQKNSSFLGHSREAPAGQFSRAPKERLSMRKFKEVLRLHSMRLKLEKHWLQTGSPATATDDVPAEPSPEMI